MGFFRKLFGGGEKPDPKGSTQGEQQPAPPAPEPVAPPADPARADHLLDVSGLDWSESSQREFLSLIKKHHGEKVLDLLDDPRFVESGSCKIADALVIYTMMAEWECSRIMQVGSGSSTVAFRHVLAARTLPAELIVIDEKPFFDLVDITDAHLENPLQDIPNDDFDIMQENEIVFFSTNHIAVGASDTAVAFQRIIPALKPGMIIGFDRITLPRDYSKDELLSGCNEQDLLLDFLRQGNHEIIYAGAWLRETMGQEWQESFKGLEAAPDKLQGSHSLWIRLR